MNGAWLSLEGGQLGLDAPDQKRGGRAAFVDRDGVINEAVPDPDTALPESPLRAADVRLLPGAASALARLAGAGYALVCVSNQPAAAKGKIGLAEVREIHERVLELLADEGVRLDASRMCPHHPDGVIAELAGTCRCRKPAPGMLLDAAAAMELDLGASWIMGDTDADMQAGTGAGCRAVLIDYHGSAHKRTQQTIPTLRAPDLHEGVERLLEQDGD